MNTRFINRNTVSIIGFVSLMLAASMNSHAEMAACSSAYVKKDLDQQIRLYTTCIRGGNMSRSGLAGAFLNRAVAYMGKGELDLAMADLNKSIEYDPKFGLTYFNRALVHMHLANLSAAEEDLNAAIKRPPSRVRAEAFAFRGLMRFYQGNCDSALIDFDDAIQKDRKLAWAYSSKAWALATCTSEKSRNGVEALVAAQKSLGLQDHWRAHDALAAAHAEIGEFEESVKEIDRAREMADTESSEWSSELQARRDLYKSGQPFRESIPDPCCDLAWIKNVY